EQAAQRSTGTAHRETDALASRLAPALASQTRRARQEFGKASARFLPALPQAAIGRARQRAEALERMLSSLGYGATLARGYAVVRGDGKVLTSTKAAAAANELEVQFSDGRIKIGGKAKGAQGSLF
ncbi:MAG: exodeoxyribonuclease VII large subunit, partial [Rhodobacteraceae bacterium]|nr:exodeoxyribonuclease VII large subunit [Paracoccaceae bacterium]